jgi:hypothetical protein
MGELKPLGSEKLNNEDKLKRILELTYFNTNKKTSVKKSELVKESSLGGVFGIVKEKDGYYVKKGLNEQTLDYIGGMFMKNKNKFSSYAEALKRLNLLQGQEELQESTKYVLKQNKPQQEAPVSEPSMDLPPAESPSIDASSDVPKMDKPMGDTPPSDEPSSVSSEPSKRSDYMAEVQKYAGKLGQELRDLHDKMESDDIKYVLNMVISAVNLDKLDDEDIDEIGKKFEREEGEMGGEDESGMEEPTSDEEPSGEDTDTMKSIEEFIKSPIMKKEVDLSSYVSQEDENFDLGNHADLEELGEEKEIDLDEIRNSISQAVGHTLSKYFN